MVVLKVEGNWFGFALVLLLLWRSGSEVRKQPALYMYG